MGRPAMIKITLILVASVAYAMLCMWAEARDARDWLTHMRKGMEPGGASAAKPVKRAEQA